LSGHDLQQHRTVRRQLHALASHRPPDNVPAWQPCRSPENALQPAWARTASGRPVAGPPAGCFGLQCRQIISCRAAAPDSSDGL